MNDGLDTLAQRHARDLLGRLGETARITVAADHPALAWRRAGLMAVTGHPDGPGLVAPVALASAADGAIAAFAALAPSAMLPENGAALLGERARLLGLGRRGAISPNGSCRLLAARDGRIALNLPRAEDWDAVPAMLGAPASDWEAIARLVARQDRAPLLAQGRLLGMAIVADEPAAPASPFTVERLGRGGRRKTEGLPTIVDLSGLWAGPLAGSLLHAAGGRVIKVESARRPDGARGGNAQFYDLLNAGKESVVLDFGDSEGVRRLRTLVDAADIVIEASRPRALAALGITAQDHVARGATWISITAHGRTPDRADRIGFGDDAAVAGGLSDAMCRAWGAPLFAGDAIADPLTGITAALAGWASWRQGGGRLIALALADVVAHAGALCEAADVAVWQECAEADPAPLYTMRPPLSRARALGADTDAVLAAFA